MDATKPTFKHVEIVTPSAVDKSGDVLKQELVHSLPLALQVAFLRKVLATLALQLSLVATAVAIFEGTSSTSVPRDIASSAASVLGLCIGIIVSLIVLYKVRDKAPLNWIFLAIFSATEVLTLLTIDQALDSHVALTNCVFTWVWVAFMMVLSGWTARDGTVRSPFVTGAFAFVLSSLVVVLAVFACEIIVFVEVVEFVISLVLQIALLSWFSKEIKGMRAAMRADDYMRGVIYLYVDLLVLLLVVVVAFTTTGDVSTGVAYSYVAVDANLAVGTTIGDEEA